MAQIRETDGKSRNQIGVEHTLLSAHSDGRLYRWGLQLQGDFVDPEKRKGDTAGGKRSCTVCSQLRDLNQLLQQRALL
jgi:hypothetical protein